jgi:hypothetical protein
MPGRTREKEEARMAAMMKSAVADRIVEIRNLWHFKNHPFFRAFAEGKLPLKSLGRYQALHYHFVSKALPSFGIFYARAYQYEDVRKAMAENLAEEEGLKAIPTPGHEPHDHNELIFRFCRAAGLSDDEVRSMRVPASWLPRQCHRADRRRPRDADDARRPDARPYRRGSAARFREALRLQAQCARDRVLHRA